MKSDDVVSTFEKRNVNPKRLESVGKDNSNLIVGDDKQSSAPPRTSSSPQLFY